MTTRFHQAVCDCVVFAQALINPAGPAARCIEEARLGRVRLYVTDYILDEIRQVPAKIRSKRVTFEQAERLVDKVLTFAVHVRQEVPVVYTHPITRQIQRM